MALPYRCSACEDREFRCTPCRERRAEARRATRAGKRADGTCTECTRKALKGQSRCQLHRAENNARSGAAHAAARKEQA